VVRAPSAIPPAAAHAGLGVTTPSFLLAERNGLESPMSPSPPNIPAARASSSTVATATGPYGKEVSRLLCGGTGGRIVVGGKGLVGRFVSMLSAPGEQGEEIETSRIVFSPTCGTVSVE
jgi:hypothetical protein